jgi:hypothetical protein
MTHSTIMRNWKWLFMNGSKSKRPASTAPQILNSCQDRTNLSVLRDTVEKWYFRGMNQLHLILQWLPFLTFDLGNIVYWKTYPWIVQLVLEVLVGAGNKELLPSDYLGSSNGSVTRNGTHMTIWNQMSSHHPHTHLCDRTYIPWHLFI